MGFTRSTTDISVHQKLGDYPNQDNGLTPEELKKRYDYPVETLQKDLNKLEEELESVVGAANIGALSLDDADDSLNNVQEKLKYIYGQLQNVSLGQIPDGSITQNKLETEFSNQIAKKNNGMQEGLDSEKVGGKTYDNIHEEIINQKALYIEDEFNYALPGNTYEIMQKEYQLDDTRMISIVFNGETNRSSIQGFALFDCGTNTVIRLKKINSITDEGIFMASGEKLNNKELSDSSQYYLKLNAITYDKDTKKLTIKYVKENATSNNVSEEYNHLETRIYGMSAKI